MENRQNSIYPFSLLWLLSQEPWKAGIIPMMQYQTFIWVTFNTPWHPGWLVIGSWIHGLSNKPGHELSTHLDLVKCQITLFGEVIQTGFHFLEAPKFYHPSNHPTKHPCPQDSARQLYTVSVHPATSTHWKTKKMKTRKENDRELLKEGENKTDPVSLLYKS